MDAGLFEFAGDQLFKALIVRPNLFLDFSKQNLIIKVSFDFWECPFFYFFVRFFFLLKPNRMLIEISFEVG